MPMVYMWAAVLAVAAAVAAPAGETGDGAVRLDGVAAYVNQHVVTVSDVLLRMEPIRRRLSATLHGEELSRRLEQAYTQALDGIIERRVILDAYEAGQGRLPEWLVDQRAEEVIKDTFSGSRSALMEALAAEGMTYAEWRETVKEHMIVQSMLAAHVNRFVHVSPGEVRAHYDANPAAFRTEPLVRVRLLVLTPARVNDPERRARRAAELAARARAGEDFAMLARQYSDDARAADGGDWGWGGPQRELAAALAERALALAPDEVSDPITLAGNAYVLKVDGRREASVAPFASVQTDIERQLRAEAGEKVRQNWVERLKADAFIRILPRADS